MKLLALHAPESNDLIPSGYLTVRQAAERLGMAPTPAARRVLLRRLLAREMELGEPIMIRHGGCRQVRYFITLPLLEVHCPELFARRVQLTEELRREVDDIRSDVGRVKEAYVHLARERGDQKRPEVTNAETVCRGERMDGQDAAE